MGVLSHAGDEQPAQIGLAGPGPLQLVDADGELPRLAAAIVGRGAGGLEQFEGGDYEGGEIIGFASCPLVLIDEGVCR